MKAPDVDAVASDIERVIPLDRCDVLGTTNANVSSERHPTTSNITRVTEPRRHNSAISSAGRDLNPLGLRLHYIRRIHINASLRNIGTPCHSARTQPTISYVLCYESVEDETSTMAMPQVRNPSYACRGVLNPEESRLCSVDNQVCSRLWTPHARPSQDIDHCGE